MWGKKVNAPQEVGGGGGAGGGVCVCVEVNRQGKGVQLHGKATHERQAYNAAAAREMIENIH